ncbi:hypothetical protein T01_12450 [Trichinella spiralis]|uniref:Uncharacterized protein n=1 Tax=Trichinella spiralis TaxID=6334 RepID=A0A0V1B0C1_TRISP|nr:hypothetical protein T01_12450 [Trichinella spiralis]
MLRIHGAVGDKVHRKSLSTFNLLRCCMLSAMSAENPVSQKCIEEKGTNIHNVGNTCSTIISQEWISHKFIDQVLSFHVMKIVEKLIL